MYYYHCVLLDFLHIPRILSSMIERIIVPIVKNKCGNNYRPIALATIMSKLFEFAIL